MKKILSFIGCIAMISMIISCDPTTKKDDIKDLTQAKRAYENAQGSDKKELEEQYNHKVQNAIQQYGEEQYNNDIKPSVEKELKSE